MFAGRSVRATARFANVLACSFAETAKSLPGKCYVTGTPIRSFAGHDRASARQALQLEAEHAGRVRLRRLAGGAPSQSGGVGRAAAHRRDDHGHPHDRRARLCRRAQGARAAAHGLARQLQAVSVPARGDDRRAEWRATCSLAAPARRRSPRPARWGCPWSSCPTRMPARTRWRMHAHWPRRERRASSPTRTSTPPRCYRRSICSTTKRRWRRCEPRHCRSAVRAPPPLSLSSSWPSPSTPSCPPQRPSSACLANPGNSA